jgi:hypothetical protein
MSVKSKSELVHGVLLLYHDRLSPDASTVLEHVRSFKLSQFHVSTVNTFWGFPKALASLRFDVLVLHYSLFGVANYCLDDQFLDYLDRSASSYKIAFFQDEYQFCQQRFAFIDRYKIESVYTLLEPRYFKDVYLKYTNVSQVTNNIPGYVSDNLIAVSGRMFLPDEKRSIDIGYRGRKLPHYMGRGAREKYDIAIAFTERAKDLGFKLDIQAHEHGRLYGSHWQKFMANCRATLGVEAGVSIYDLDYEAYSTYCRAVLGQDAEPPGPKWYSQFVRLAAKEEAIDAGELADKLLAKWENNIPYRTISPRHFEAAAFRTCQILFEGNYSGIMQPFKHYIPLKKDFSNFDEVISIFKNKRERQEITENAYSDLIASKQYSYKVFIAKVDAELIKRGLRPQLSRTQRLRIDVALYQEELHRRTRWKLSQAKSKFRARKNC